MTELSTAATDATLPSAGYLFGADSNAAAEPSKYSVQAVANAVSINVGQMMVRATVDFNVGATDTAIAIILPEGRVRYRVASVHISGASASLTTATAGVFTAAGGAGVAIVTAASAITVSTAAENTLSNTQAMTVNNTNTQSYTATTLYFRVATPQGSAATGTVSIIYIPVS